jgi:hypothetical protein
MITLTHNPRLLHEPNTARCISFQCMPVCDLQVGGYRDLTVCVVFEDPSGLRIIGEIQVPLA